MGGWNVMMMIIMKMMIKMMVVILDGGGGRSRRANMLYNPTLQYQCLKTIMSCNVNDYPVSFY